MIATQSTNDIESAIRAISLIDGKFTASEAADILNALLDKKINFHKIQRLKRLEGNSDDQCRFDSGRLGELTSEKDRLKTILREVRKDGKKLVITSTINIEITD
jgi:hypothetical protein